jgi:hypothetical protein
MEITKEKSKEKVADTCWFYFQFPFASMLAYISIFILNMPWITIFVVYGLIPYLDGVFPKD